MSTELGPSSPHRHRITAARPHRRLAVLVAVAALFGGALAMGSAAIDLPILPVPTAGAETPAAELHVVVADVVATSKHGGLLDVGVTSGTVTQIAGSDAAIGFLSQPYGVAVEADGSYVLADRTAFAGRHGGLIRVDPKTGEQNPLSSNQYFGEPTGIAIAPGGSILVADAQALDASRTNRAGGVISVDPISGVQTLVATGGKMVDPTGIAVAPNGAIFVADRSAQATGGSSGAIIRIDADGSQHLIASHGQFHHPRDLVVAPNGDVYVVDPDWDGGDGGVIRIPVSAATAPGDPDMHPTIAAGDEVTAHDDWGNPYGITLAPNGHLIVADPDYYKGDIDAYNRLRIGAIVDVDPASGSSRIVTGRAQLRGPTGVAVVPEATTGGGNPTVDPLAPVTFRAEPEAPLCSSQTYTVPANVTQLAFTVVGAAGAPGQTANHSTGGPGGFGAVVSGTLSVAPGQTWSVSVGNNGTGGAGRGGFGDGGAATFLARSIDGPASDGGCATTDLAVVAGGGGGGGGASSGGSVASNGGDGGNGGLPTGGAGGKASTGGAGGGGQGGSQTAGGPGGSALSGTPQEKQKPGQPGARWVGGAGSAASGGGGGGGYFGGGGGGGGEYGGVSYDGSSPGGGGGGGSSYVDHGLVSGESFRLAGARGMAPMIMLTPVITSANMTLTASTATPKPFEDLTLTATVTPNAGSTLPQGSMVTFYPGAPEHTGYPIAVVPVDLATGKASFTSSWLFTTLGAANFTAEYYDVPSAVIAPRATATTSVTFTAVASAPTAADVTRAGETNVPLSITLQGTGAAGDVLRYTITSQPSHATISGWAPNLVLTPDPGFEGNDSFTYTTSYAISPGTSSAATVHLSFAPVQHLPVATDLAVTTDEDQPIAVYLSGSDADGDALTYSVVTPPANGTVDLTGTFPVYTPHAGFHGADSFTYTANDGHQDSQPATVTVTVNHVNHAPVPESQTVVVTGETPVTLSATDSDGDDLDYKVIINPQHGTLSGTAPNLTYTPDADYTGPDWIAFTASDGTEAVGTTIFLQVGTMPVAYDVDLSFASNSAPTVVLRGSGGDGSSLTYAVVDGPDHGQLESCADGDSTCLYYPWLGTALDAGSTTTFTYTVTDGTSTSAPATVTLHSIANNPPVVHCDYVETYQGVPVVIHVLDNDSDPDGDALSISGIGESDSSCFGSASTPRSGSAVGTDNNTTITYTPGGTMAGDISYDWFTYSVVDSAGTDGRRTSGVQVTVKRRVTAGSDSATTQQDQTVTIPVLANDSDALGKTVHITTVDQPGHGTTSLDTDGRRVVYTPAAGFHGSDSFTYQAGVTQGSDTYLSNKATVTITVDAVNAAPVAQGDTATVAAGGTVAVDALANDSDPDGDDIQIESLSEPAQGSVTVDSAGRLVYTADSDASGTDRFIYSVTDGSLASTAATVVVTITEPPTGQQIAFTPPAATTLGAGPVPLSASASSGLPVTLTSRSPDVCSVSAAAAALLEVGTCTIAANQAGSDSFAPAIEVVRSFAVTPVPPDPTSGGGSPAPSSDSGAPETVQSTTPAVSSVPGSPAVPVVLPPVEVPAGGTASSGDDPAGAGLPVEAAVTSPVAGEVTFTMIDEAPEPVSGYTVLGHQVHIEAPTASAEEPLRLAFTLDNDALDAAGDGPVVVFRDGVAVAECATPHATAADPDPCVTSRSTTGGVATVVVLSSHASVWTFGLRAGADDATVTAEPAPPGGGTTEASDEPEVIAYTGVSPGVPLGVAGALLLLGVVLLLAGRKSVAGRRC